MLSTPPLSLYVHFPWCVRKCPYCDFNSHTLKNDLPEQQYLAALLQDLDADLNQVQNRTIHSVFFGGGTPSLFSAPGLAYLLSEFNKRLTFSSNIEITLEANPGTFEYERFKDYRAIGINRLSIGIQSFQDEQLKILGRIHGRQEAIRAAETAHKAGFSNFNLDLMHGLPKQSLPEALKDLTTAINLLPTHLSWYQLTLEPNTLFHKNPPPLPDDELIWEMQDKGKELLIYAGFKQYEISAYCKPKQTCAHNTNYWKFGDYLGIGAGAHSKITDTSGQTITRTWKQKNPKDYLNPNHSFMGTTQVISKSELAFEFMLNALRLYEAIPVLLFEQRTGLSLQDITENLKQAQHKQLLTWDHQTIYPTSLGRRFYNDLVALFMNE